MSNVKDDKRKVTSSGSSEKVVDLHINGPFKGPEENIAGTIYVNQKNRIKCVISSITELINSNSFNEDLEIKDFSQQLKYEGITDDIRYVLKYRDRVQKEVEGKSGRWYLMELHPHSPEDDIEGVVITFVDITQLKDTEQKLAEKIEKNKELQQQIIKKDVSERWRIGQFLHDNIGQTLVAAELLLQETRKKLARGEKGVEEDIDQVLEILRESNTDVRDLSHDIMPIQIEEHGITQVFRNFGRQLEKRYDIHCDLEYDITPDNITNIEVATHLYHIAQESVKNAVLHGNAEHVKISLRSDEDYMYLTIEDDGTGFSDSSTGDEGRGIDIMRHRMEMVDGKFEILDTSDLGNEGITVSCKLPIEKL
ncbi:ATP-binding protein [Fodinibius sp. N2]|uniref:ATP-binding protein n=1 Tax=Fodinibius alkaliphilus TaxID=3140241 RepID=UPI00315A2C9A